MDFDKTQKGQLLGKEVATRKLLADFENRLKHHEATDKELDEIELKILNDLLQQVKTNGLVLHSKVNLYKIMCSAITLRQGNDLKKFRAAAGYVFTEEGEAEDVVKDQLADRRVKAQVELFLHHQAEEAANAAAALVHKKTKKA